MWIGAISGVGLAFLLGVGFIVAFYVANTQVFSGKGQALFKGFIFYVAIVLVTFVAIKMLSFYNMEKKWKYKLRVMMAEKKTAERKNKWSMCFLAFSATLREGIEAVLFLTGVSSGDSVKAVIIPSLIGAVLGILAGLVVFYLGKSIRSLKWFFIASTGFLLLIAAGMTQNGTAAFQAAGWFGNTFPYERVPWSNRILWDTNSCCNPDTNNFWSLIRALFGYQSMPTNIQLLYYCLFWAVVVAGLVFRWKMGKLTDEHTHDYDVVDRLEAEDAAVDAQQQQQRGEGEAGRKSWTTTHVDLEPPSAGLHSTAPVDAAVSNPLYQKP